MHEGLRDQEPRSQAQVGLRSGQGREAGTREDAVGARLLADPDQEGPQLVARGLQSVQGFRERDPAKEPPAGRGDPEPRGSPPVPPTKSQPT